MAKISKNQIIFDSEDFIAGFARNFAIKAVVNNSNQSVSNIDPFRDYGILQPGRKPSDATNNAQLGGVMIAMALKNSTLAYGVDTGGKFHEYTYSTNAITNAGSFPHTITGTSPVGQDAIVYKHNSSGTPVYSPFYSYYNNANWDIGAYINYTTIDDDFMSSVPATPLDITSGDGDDTTQRTAPHPMAVGADDVLYIGSGRYLHAYDGAQGTNGTFQSKVLSLPLGFVITGLLRYQDTMLIAGTFTASTGSVSLSTTGSSGEAVIYVWNYIDLDITQVIPLDDPIVQSIFSWRGKIGVITIGESEGFGTLNGTKVKIVTGNTAEKVAEFQGSVAFRGVDGSSRVLYVNADGKIYGIGDNVQEGFPVNLLMTCSQTGVGGWIKNVVTYNILASGSDGSSSHAQCSFSTSNYATSARFITSYYQVPVPPKQRAKVTSVEVEFFSTVTSAKAELTLQLVYDMNAGSSNSTVVQRLDTIAVPAQKVYIRDVSGNPFNEFGTIGLDASWSEESANLNATAPAISRVIINFEPLDIKS